MCVTERERERERERMFSNLFATSEQNVKDKASESVLFAHCLCSKNLTSSFIIFIPIPIFFNQYILVLRRDRESGSG